MLNAALPTDTKHIYVITWSQLNHPSFAQESAVCTSTKQDLGSEYSMLPSVTTHSSFTSSVMMSVIVSKVGVVLWTLVYWCQQSRRNSNEVTPNRSAKYRWGKLQSMTFDQYLASLKWIVNG